MSKTRCIALAVALALGACGGRDVSNDDAGGSDGAVVDASQRPDTLADGTPKPDAATPDAPRPPDIGARDTTVDMFVGDLPPVEAGAPAASDKCATPEVLTFTAGKASASGDTRGYSDTHANLTCGASTTKLAGSDRYYAFTAAGGSTYEIDVGVARTAHVYGFAQSAGCSDSAIKTACSSDGKSGFVLLATPGGVNKVLFKPATAGAYVIAIDASAPGLAGPYTLRIVEHATPANATCATPQLVTFTNGRAEINGDTTGAVDELPTLTCANTTPMVGPQTYYEITAQAGKVYRLTFTPSVGSYLYVFDATVACTAGAINASCGSSGKTGIATANVIPGGLTRSILFRPDAPGRYKIAVDSWVASNFGPFKLVIDEIGAPANDTCASAQALVVPSGGAAVSATGETAGAKNELGALDCGLLTGNPAQPLTYVGRDVFYRFTARKGQPYKITIDPQYSGYIYAWSDASPSCTSATIQKTCTGKGIDGATASFSSGTPRSVIVNPSVDGSYGIGVGSIQNNSGAFSIRVAEFNRAGNDTCAKAAPLTLTNGQVSVTGDTTDTADEFPGLTCNTQFSTTKLVAPNVYYTFDAVAGKSYELTLDAQFLAYLFVFDASVGCTEAAIQASCGSKGVSGDSFTRGLRQGRIIFTPPKAGKYTLGVDSFNAAQFGGFTLTVKENSATSQPANGVCSGAQVLSLTNGAVSVSGDTTGVRDEHATLKCGGPALIGSQLYYRFTATAGKTYALSFSPKFDGYVYGFPASANCALAGIETACSSGGATGFRSAFTIATTTSTTTFKAPSSGDVVVGVDSTTILRAGAFDLRITEQ